MLHTFSEFDGREKQFTINLLNFAGHSNQQLMDYRFFFKAIGNIIFHPANVWESADTGASSVRFTRNSFLVPLIILVSISAFAGSLFFSNSELSVSYSILTGIKCFGLLYGTIYASAWIFGEITHPLDLGKDFPVSFQIVVYTTAPFLLCQVVSRIFDSLLFVNIIGLYGLFIFWNGMEKLLNPAQYKKVPLLIATVISIAGIYIFTNLVLARLTDMIYFTFLA